MLEAEAATGDRGARARAEDRGVVADDAWYLKRGLTVRRRSATRWSGAGSSTARRTGKQLLVDTTGVGRSRTPGPVLGLHLGMSGRVVIDGESAGDPLLYASNAENPAWLRFGVEFADGGSLWMRDPRRLGAVELDPDESRFGPDAAARRSRARSTARSAGASRRSRPCSWIRRASPGSGTCSPTRCCGAPVSTPRDRPAVSTMRERAALLRAIRQTVRVLGRRGGSHTGDLQASRARGGVCPRDGAELLRRTVGGRTTYSCPVHQR